MGEEEDPQNEVSQEGGKALPQGRRQVLRDSLPEKLQKGFLEEWEAGKKNNVRALCISETLRFSKQDQLRGKREV